MSRVPYAQALPLNSKVRSYRIQRVLGQGGYAFTYAARAKNGELVAIKELFPEDFSQRTPNGSVGPKPGSEKDFKYVKDRFIREAKMVCGFNHPNLLRGLEWFEENSTVYIVMRYESGLSLQQHLRSRNGSFQVNPGTMAKLMRGLLNGLEVAHQQDCLHCDIKPGNIYLGEGFQPVLLDFGAARHALHERLYQANESLVAITDYYAPIEQYPDHASEIGPWTDIYQLAAVVYRCLTGGKIPNAIDRVVKDAPDPYYPLSQLVIKGKGYPPEFLKAIDSALQVNPRNRPQSITQWRRELNRPLKRMEKGASKSRTVSTVRERPIVDTVSDTELPAHIAQTQTMVTEIAKSGYERRKTMAPRDYEIDKDLRQREMSRPRISLPVKLLIVGLVIGIVVLSAMILFGF